MSKYGSYKGLQLCCINNRCKSTYERFYSKSKSLKRSEWLPIIAEDQQTEYCDYCMLPMKNESNNQKLNKEVVNLISDLVSFGYQHVPAIWSSGNFNI